MTKQKEIRDGILLIIDNLVEGNKVRLSTNGMADLYTEKILEYLHSQDVAIETDSKLPPIFGNDDELINVMDYVKKLKGYKKTAPLI